MCVCVCVLNLCGSKFKRMRGITIITQFLLIFVSSDEVCVYCKCLLICKNSKIDFINIGIISLIFSKNL